MIIGLIKLSNVFFFSDATSTDLIAPDRNSNILFLSLIIAGAVIMFISIIIVILMIIIHRKR